MSQRTVTVASSAGLHARPAMTLVQAVAASGHTVTIAKAGGDPVDAGSILMVMALGAECGDQVTIDVEGEGSEQLLDELARIIETDLDAE